MAVKTYDFAGWATKNDLRCSDGRIIRKNAFKDDNGKTVPLVWNHDHSNPENVLGHAYLQNREDGVYAYCSFNDTEGAKPAKQLLEHGDIGSRSIHANKLKQSKNKEDIMKIISTQNIFEGFWEENDMTKTRNLELLIRRKIKWLKKYIIMVQVEEKML